MKILNVFRAIFASPFLIASGLLIVMCSSLSMIIQAIKE